MMRDGHSGRVSVHLENTPAGLVALVRPRAVGAGRLASVALGVCEHGGGEEGNDKQALHEGSFQGTIWSAILIVPLFL